MFIVKLILVPFWPIFLTNWLKEKVPGGVTFKSYMATLVLIYALFIFGIVPCFYVAEPNRQVVLPWDEQ